MNKNKTAGTDGIIIEIVLTLEKFWIDKVTEIKEIYDSGEVPGDLSRYIFIAMLKKPVANVCELHWTLSIMSYITNH